MSKIASAVVLSEAVRKQLESWVRAQFTPQQVALRSRILLMAADGKQDLEIADELDVNRHTPALWRKRFQTEGLEPFPPQCRSMAVHVQFISNFQVLFAVGSHQQNAGSKRHLLRSELGSHPTLQLFSNGLGEDYRAGNF